MRVVLATPPDKRWAQIMVDIGAQSLLMSYWYFRDLSYDRCREILQILKKNNVWLMVDSGAYTFFQEFKWLHIAAKEKDFKDPESPYQKRLRAGLPTSREALVEEADEYIEKYIKWVQTFYAEGLIHSWAEVDICELVGMQHVYRWREQWKDAGVAEGLIVTVHITNPMYERGELHQGQDQEDIARMMTGEFGYVGFGNIPFAPNRVAHPWIFNQYIPIMRERRIRTHGWAMTSKRQIEYFPWYSVDSSSWSAYGRWGIIYKYDPATQRIRQSYEAGGHDRKSYDIQRINWMHNVGLFDQAEKLGILEDLKRMDPIAIDTINAYQWVLLQRAKFDDVRLAYWLTDKEKMEIDRARRARANVSDSARKTTFFPRSRR